MSWDSSLRSEARRKAIEAVRALHSQSRRFPPAGRAWCVECRCPWPCTTERAIREALGEES